MCHLHVYIPMDDSEPDQLSPYLSCTFRGKKRIVDYLRKELYELSKSSISPHSVLLSPYSQRKLHSELRARLVFNIHILHACISNKYHLVFSAAYERR